MIKIPKRFYDDHVERNLPAPPVLKETKAHYWISDEMTPELVELYSDARYYGDDLSDFYLEVYGICMSGRATAKAIKAAVPEISPAHEC